jgi:transcriptional regulator with GAF, ATPase, and Fis domain
VDARAAQEMVGSEREPRVGRRERPSEETIRKALEKAKGVQGEAARILGIHERQLARWMDDLGIPRARSRS